jgi:hypothetical protein
MRWIDVLALLVAAAAAGTFAFYVYRLREPAVRGRTWLGVLRAGALLLLLLIMLNPALPLPGQRRGPAERVLLDASLSMRLPDTAAPGGTRWSAALAAARRLAPDADVLLFGGDPEVVSPRELAERGPDAPVSRLAPALRAAAEAGAQRAVVITDGGVEDVAEARRWAERLGLAVRFEHAGVGPAANRSLAELEAPSWAEAGAELEIRVGVAVAGAAEGPIRVVVFEGEEQRAELELAPPQAGALAVGTLRFPARAPPGGGRVRYDVRLQPFDALPEDDERPVYVYVSERPAGVTLVSFAPDWEPRFLAPALERSLGLPLRAYLRVGDDRYLRLAAGAEAGRPATEAEVRRSLAEGEVVVLHGPGRAPGWAVEAARRARRLLLFSDEQTPAGLVPVSLGPGQAGDWYIGEQLPPSPLAGALAGLPAAGLPPLPLLRPAGQEAPGATAALHAYRARRGEPAPVLLLGEAGGRRWAAAVGTGYWLWAMRGDEAALAYRQLWAAVGGWLVRDAATVAGEAIRPAERVAARGRPLRWVAPGLAVDSLALRLTDAAGRTHTLGVAVPEGADGALSPPLPPGHYQYVAAAFAADAQLASAQGAFSVESWSPEFLEQGRQLEGVTPPAAAARPARSRPFRTSPLPYALVLGLLGAEWILRRRWGLR